MQQIGVMAVVEGLAGFTSDINKIGGLLDGLRPRATLLQDAFKGIGESITGFGERVMNVFEVALGVLLRDAIRGTIDLLREMGQAAVDAAADFQLLNLRLLGLNMQEATERGLDYVNATIEATKRTKDQLVWVMKLASTTPYDATDIAKVYTMATSYGFASTMASRLTENTMDFASAMGLESEALDRIMVNFGQMVQRGKVTTRELNDLARGSMLPIADVLDIMAKRMGISVQKLTEEISKPGGVAAEEFINAFNEMIETGVRFEDASQRMARTFRGATENISQTVRDLLGFYVIQPVLDVLGGKLADVIDAFTDEKNWGRLTTALGSIGDSFKYILDTLLGGFEPGAFADKIIGEVEKIATWIDNNKTNIISFFQELWRIIAGKPEEEKPGLLNREDLTGEVKNQLEGGGFGEGILAVVQKIADFVRNNLVPAFDEFKNWVTENKPLIKEFFETLGTIIEGVVNNLIGSGKGKGGAGEGLLGTVTGFMQFVVDNQDTIITVLTHLVKFVALYLILSTVQSAAINALLSLVTAPGLVLLYNLIAAIPAALYTLATVDLKGLIETVKSVDWEKTVESWAIDIVDGLIRFFKAEVPRFLNSLRESARTGGSDFTVGFVNGLASFAINVGAAIRNAFRNISAWYEGKTIGEGIVSGIAAGISSGAGAVFTAIATLVSKMIANILTLLRSKSPSRVMFDIGKDVIGEGLIQGIEAFTSPAVATMANAMRAVTSAASPSYSMAPSTVSTAYNTSNTYNLAIHSRARTEQVAQDFNMMQSMVGV